MDNSRKQNAREIRNSRFIFFSVLFIFTGLILILVFYFQWAEFNPKRIALAANTQCQSDQSNRCFSKFFSTFSKAHQFEKTKEVLDELQKINTKMRYCHRIAHAISVVEVEKDPENWLEVFSNVPDRECSYGFFHGVIEGKYRYSPNFKVNQHLITQICVKEVSQRARSGCAHAFGHVLLIQTEGNLENALVICNEISNPLNEACYQGVFMENIQKENLSEHGIANREDLDRSYLDKQIVFCSSFRYKQLSECWRSLGSIIHQVTIDNPHYGSVICKTAPTYFALRACGREVNGQNLIYIFSQNMTPRTDLCKPYNSDNQKYRTCIEDILTFVLLTSQEYRVQLNSFCKKVEAGDRSYCEQRLKDFTY